MAALLLVVAAGGLARAAAWNFHVLRGTTPPPPPSSAALYGSSNPFDQQQGGPMSPMAPMATPTSAQMMGNPGGAYASAAMEPTGIESTANLVAMSKKTADMIGGTVESFLGGSKAFLSPHELECLSSGASKLSGGMLDTAGRAAQTMKAYSAHAKMTNAIASGQMTPTMASAYPGMGQYGTAAAPVGEGAGVPPVDPLVAGLEITSRISRLMDLENKVAEHCLHNDAKVALKKASKHMRNMTYVGGHLVSNGVDIMKELTEAADAYEKGDYREFGDSFGMAARKTLLSREGEGFHDLMRVPEKEDIEAVTKGLVGSVFGKGMSMEVWSDPVTTMAPPPAQYFSAMQETLPNGTVVGMEEPPALVPWVLLPATDVKVDLHSCVQGNEQLFRTAWQPVFKVMNKMAASSSSADGMSALEKGTATGAEGMGALAMSMLDMQIALRRCGFTTEQESILWDAMEAGKGSVHTKFHVPDGEASKMELSSNMASAVKEWQNEDYKKFGARVGVTLREMAVDAFPEKYYVDSTGALRRKILGLEAAARADAPRLGGAAGAVLAQAALAASLLAAAGLLVARGRHLVRAAVAGARDDDEAAAALTRETEVFVRVELDAQV